MGMPTLTFWPIVAENRQKPGFYLAPTAKDKYRLPHFWARRV